MFKPPRKAPKIEKPDEIDEIEAAVIRDTESGDWRRAIAFGIFRILINIARTLAGRT